MVGAVSKTFDQGIDENKAKLPSEKERAQSEKQHLQKNDDENKSLYGVKNYERSLTQETKPSPKRMEPETKSIGISTERLYNPRYLLHRPDDKEYEKPKYKSIGMSTENLLKVIKLEPTDVEIPPVVPKAQKINKKHPHEKYKPKFEIVGSSKTLDPKLKQEKSTELFRLLQGNSKELKTAKNPATQIHSNLNNPTRTPYIKAYDKTIKNSKLEESNDFKNQHTKTKKSKGREKTIKKVKEIGAKEPEEQKIAFSPEQANKQIYREGQDLSQKSKKKLPKLE